MVPRMSRRIVQCLRYALPAGGLRPHLRWPVGVGLLAMVALAVAAAALRPAGAVRASQAAPATVAARAAADQPAQTAVVPALAAVADQPATPDDLASAGTSSRIAPTTTTGTIVPAGTITTSQTWTAAGSPYILDGGASVGRWTLTNQVVTLTIEPGVEVRLGKYASLTVAAPDPREPSYGTGVLIAEGTPTQPITFTSNQSDPRPGDWAYLSLSGPSRLSYCDVGYGGGTPMPVAYWWGGYYWPIGTVSVGPSTDVQIRHCRIHDSGNHGIAITSKSSTGPSSWDYVPILLDDVTFSGNTYAAIAQLPNSRPTYRDLRFAGNGHDGIFVYLDDSSQKYVFGSHHWGIGGPGGRYLLPDDLIIPAGSALSLEPGTTLQFITGTGLTVLGTFVALGTPAAPITLTGSVAQPGSWTGVDVAPGAIALLDRSSLLYGGSAPHTGGAPQALLTLGTSSAEVRNGLISGSASDGIRVWNNARPTIAYNQIVSNTVGVTNTGTFAVDVRNNWWGDPSGPTLAANPAGRGDRAGGPLLFEPWLTSPATGVSTAGSLLLTVLGPREATPGETVNYVVDYANLTTRTVESAVLLALLPAAELVESTAGAIEWPERNQVFWKLGDLAPGAKGSLYLRVRYQWGLPLGTEDSLMAVLLGAGMAGVAFDVAEYLAYTPELVAQSLSLSAGQVEAERTGNAEFGLLYSRALAAGFTHAYAYAHNLSSGRVITQVLLLRAQPRAGMYLERLADTVLATTFDRGTWTVADTTGGITVSQSAPGLEFWGEWAPPTPDRVAAASIQFRVGCFLWEIAKSGVKVGLGTKYKSLGVAIDSMPDCMSCALGFPPKQDPNGQKRAAACAGCADAGREIFVESTKASVAVKFLQAALQCTGAEPVKCNEGDRIITCEVNLWGRAQQWAKNCVYAIYKCRNGEFYFLDIPEYRSERAGVNGPLKCVTGVGCVDCGDPAGRETYATDVSSAGLCVALAAAGGQCGVAPTRMRTAHDPNALYGETGEVVPGQLLTYTVTYENEGAGRAYGVYVADTLGEYFDDTTLALQGNALYLGTNRTIIWSVGELAAKGEAGSTGAVTFTVRLKPDLPSGTVVINQATVFFPSVPEETPTNPLVNVVRPLVASPLLVQTDYGTPVDIRLQGVDVSGYPLTYTVTGQPLYGALSGLAPTLRYTPVADFTGPDRFTFKVGNGITESRPAEVQILVNPSAVTDKVAPVVRSTEPVSGATNVKVNAGAVLTDTLGPSYLPSVAVQFSEPLSATTVTTGTVRLADSAGRAVAVSVSYDGTANQIAIVPREPWRTTRYVVTVATGVKDASGNALAADYTFSFDVAVRAAVAQQYRVYLPATFKKKEMAVGW